MSVRQLRLELQGDEAEAGVEELDLLHAEADPRHVVVTAGRVVVPDGHHQALADQLAHGDPEGEGVVPDGVERLVLGGGLHVSLLEPGVGVRHRPHPARALVQQVAEGVGVLAALPEQVVGGLQEHFQTPILILDLASIKTR